MSEAAVHISPSSISSPPSLLPKSKVTISATLVSLGGLVPCQYAPCFPSPLLNAASIGPLIGGAFAVSSAGWRWSYYFNLILVGATFPVFLFILPARTSSIPDQSVWRCTRQLDVVGSFLFAGALSLGVTALSIAGALYSWTNGRTIGLISGSGFFWILFLSQQLTAIFTTKTSRILPIHILRSWEMWILIAQIGCSISPLLVTIYYGPLYFQFVRGESALRSGTDILPFLFTSVSAMLISGRLITLGYYKLWFIVGNSMTLIMSVCLYTIEINTPHAHAKIYVYLILGGIGTGLCAMNAGPIMAAIVSKEHIADASTIFGCVDAICGAISVGVANCIFINRATNNIQSILPNTPRATIQEAITGLGASFMKQLPSSVRTMALRAELEAINDVWIQMIATAALSLLLSLFLQNRKLGQLREQSERLE